MEARQASGGFPLYVSSGKISFSGLILGTICGGIAAVILAVIYAYGTIYIPIVQIEFLLTLAFGGLIGAVTGGVMRAFKMRSTALIALTGFGLGVLGWLVSWLPWIYGTFNRAGVPIGVLDVLNPLFLMDALPQIYATGTWSVGRGSSEAVSGLMLGAVWLIEAAIIIGASTMGALVAGIGRAFCERCENWCTVLDGQAFYDAGAADGIRDALLGRADLSVLATAPPPTSTERFASLTLGFCPQCGETNVVGLDIVSETRNAKGQVERNNVHHVPLVCISRDQMAWLRDGLAKQHTNVVAQPPAG